MRLRGPGPREGVCVRGRGGCFCAGLHLWGKTNKNGEVCVFDSFVAVGGPCACEERPRREEAEAEPRTAHRGSTTPSTSAFFNGLPCFIRAFRCVLIAFQVPAEPRAEPAVLRCTERGTEGGSGGKLGSCLRLVSPLFSPIFRSVLSANVAPSHVAPCSRVFLPITTENHDPSPELSPAQPACQAAAMADNSPGCSPGAPAGRSSSSRGFAEPQGRCSALII